MNYNNNKLIATCSILIIILAVLASVAGLMHEAPYDFLENFLKHHVLGQDLVALLIALPVFIFSGISAGSKGSRPYLLMTGTAGYFLYSYSLYLFMLPYSMFYIIHLPLFSLSLYTFVLLVKNINIDEIFVNSRNDMPVTFIGSMIIFSALIKGFFWIFILLVPVLSSDISTLPIISGIDELLNVISFDLGVITPLAVSAGFLLIKRNLWGYVLSGIYLTILTFSSLSIASMMLFLYLDNIEFERVVALTWAGILLSILFVLFTFFYFLKENRTLSEIESFDI